MTAGTCTTADSRTRTGRLMRSRAARRATASRHDSGTDDVPTLPSCRVTSQPDARRNDNTTTPPSQTRTTHGNAGSTAARIRPATGARTVGTADTACRPGPDIDPGATGDVAVTTSPVEGDAPLTRSAVVRGRASISPSVRVARA